MITAVDTNVPLAVLYDDEYADAAETALREAYRDGRLEITSIVYAELAADGHFQTEGDLSQFLDDFSIQVTEPSRSAVFQAGECFRRYVDHRPDGLQCPSCGTERTVSCDDCGERLAPRQHIAADFLVGGHASVDADRLLSFDTNFYSTYFPSLSVAP